ncbi:hypothetical protein AURDEDRAFT_174421 [Auricularia subglabra TFB-10046 SS5]|uniref:DUF5648 domain-containing protein n=1 Tax=Auricularia subglabra (strain TFB-10046 / SS5) TaxID=717982 RepID=J0CYZ0_AURST|nr:hypothetical protein AURDEDRAFT_174421 [Auricularia subglabra TFB-10046 SS5]
MAAGLDTLRTNRRVQHGSSELYSRLLEGPAEGHALFYPRQLFHACEPPDGIEPFESLDGLIEEEMWDNSRHLLQSSMTRTVTFKASVSDNFLPADIHPVEVSPEISRSSDDFAFLAFAGSALSELTQQCAAPGDTPVSGLHPPPITAPLSPLSPPPATSSTPRRTAALRYIMSYTVLFRILISIQLCGPKGYPEAQTPLSLRLIILAAVFTTALATAKERREWCTGTPRPFYRVWSNDTYNSDHLYFADLNDINRAAPRYKREQDCCLVFTDRNQTVQQLIPLYRLWHSAHWDHFYTINAAECPNAIAAGFNDEGIAAQVLGSKQLPGPVC